VTPIEQAIRDRIARDGPIAVADFMDLVLRGRTASYYRAGDPLGAAGDFVTAPEISQMFGELIGLWMVEVWRRAGAPARVAIVELGPGRGTLMADALRAARLAPDFRAAVELHLVEINRTLREQQAARLGEFEPRWHEDIVLVLSPDVATIVIANEFFDALPIRQFVRTGDGWRERAIGIDAASGTLRWTVLERAAAPPSAAESGCDFIEVGSEAVGLAGRIAEQVRDGGGAALIVDYGYDMPAAGGDTLQAVRDHAFHEPLVGPGTADLTAHVDFRALSRAAREAGATVHGPIPQGLFLERLGIGLRAERLKAGKSPEQSKAIDVARGRLIHPDEMGTLFKVLAIAGPDLPPPPGFEDMT